MEVEAVYPTGGRPQIELFMAVWTPGSYLVREYERHVENVAREEPGRRALTRRQDGQEPLARRDRRRAAVTRELSRLRPRDDRAQQLDRDAASRCSTARRRSSRSSAGTARPHEVRIELPPAWKDVGDGADARSPGSRTRIAPKTSTRSSTARSFSATR